jgi:uncharacterized membrane protein YqjE
MEGNSPQRFASGVSTFSLRARLLVTVPLVLLDAFLLSQLVLWSVDPESRWAMLWLFFLMLSGSVSWLLLRPLWRPSAEWRDEQWAIEQQRRRIDRAHQVPFLRDWDGSP